MAELLWFRRLNAQAGENRIISVQVDASTTVEDVMEDLSKQTGLSLLDLLVETKGQPVLTYDERGINRFSDSVFIANTKSYRQTVLRRGHNRAQIHLLSVINEAKQIVNIKIVKKKLALVKALVNLDYEVGVDIIKLIGEKIRLKPDEVKNEVKNVLVLSALKLKNDARGTSVNKLHINDLYILLNYVRGTFSIRDTSIDDELDE